MFRLFTLLCAVALVQHGVAVKLSLLGTEETRIEGTYFVGFEKGENGAKALQEVVASWPEHFDHKPEKVGLKNLNLLRVHMDDDALAHAESLDGVAYIEHDLMMRKHQAGSQNNARPGLDRIDQTTGRNGVYNFRSSGAGVDIYILDTGVDVGHPDWDNNQAQHLRDCAGANQANANACATADPGDPDGHGTHVAGIAASPTFGVAKEANIFTVRVLGANGSGSITGIIAGMLVVQQRAEAAGANPSVINMSLGGGLSNAFNNAVDAIAETVPTVVAAGNEAQDANNVSPASADNVITVGSSTRDDVYSSFSNSGPRVDIFAVGSQVRSLNANTDGSTIISGTSMASPTVAGAVAQLLGVNGDRTPEQLRALLVGTSSTNQLRGANLPGTPNRLLNVAGDAFAAENPTNPIPETEPPQETEPAPSQPVPVSDVCLSTVDSDDLVGGDDFQFQQGLLTRGLIFDAQCNEANPAMLQSITVFTTAQVVDGTAAFFYVTDFSSFQIENIERNQARWTLLRAENGDPRITVNSESQSTRIGQFDLFRTSIVLPQIHQFEPATRQGLYVTFIDNNLFAADFRGGNLDVDAMLAVNGPISIFAGRAARRRLFGGNAVDPSFPVLEMCYAGGGGASALATEAPPAGPIVRLNDQLDCLTSSNINEDTWSVQSGVMFDLTVSSLATADLPGVWLESFSVWLQDSMEAGIAEVYTTADGQSFQGQESNRDAWEMIAQRSNMNQDTFPAAYTEEGDTVIWMDDMENPNIMPNDTMIIDDIEASGAPVLYDFDFAMHYELRTDDTPQGFYVTFREDQMRYYDVADTDETSLIASNENVRMTGGVGVAYPFGEIFSPRQFSGDACFSYELSAASSVAVARASVATAIVAAFVLALFN